MNINGTPYQTIWLDETSAQPHIVTLDQRKLPHFFDFIKLHTADEVAIAIEEMWLRGAPLIGAAAGLGFYLGVLEANAVTNSLEKWHFLIQKTAEKLLKTRPTAINLAWAIERQLTAIAQADSIPQKTAIARTTALDILREDVEICRQIGVHGLELIKTISNQKQQKTVNILTHCNAGWIACVDWGTATAPIYQAHDSGIKVHVWIDETRPRNQGASLTAWELGQHGVPHTIIPDNAGGHLMQHNLVDMCIVGTDRTTITGDVANKIGTYLKALAAHDNNIPFYVALPSTTIDWNMRDGINEIPIETRSDREVHYIQGLHNGNLTEVRITPEGATALNYGFDVTPARLITGLITERGVCAANEASIKQLFQ
jgi:methylthioribose-1-phosphate isomerase